MKHTTAYKRALVHLVEYGLAMEVTSDGSHTALAPRSKDEKPVDKTVRLQAWT